MALFLHPSQERLVTRSFQGPARVLGGADREDRCRHAPRTPSCPQFLYHCQGSHPVHHIHAELGDKYSTKFAEPLRSGDRAHRRLNLHAWVMQFLNQNGRRPVLVEESESRYAGATPSNAPVGSFGRRHSAPRVGGCHPRTGNYRPLAICVHVRPTACSQPHPAR